MTVIEPARAPWYKTRSWEYGSLFQMGHNKRKNDVFSLAFFFDMYLEHFKLGVSMKSQHSGG